MTLPRTALVSLSDTPWYHVVCRCVRRAFLCGRDAYTGTSYEHRRGWVVERMKQLAGVFAIDVAAYAVMSNHYHLVVRIDVERVQGWSQREVLQRWTQLFDGPLPVQRWLAGEGDTLTEAEDRLVTEWAETYRARLSDLSWYMRVLNETIARQANTEDRVKGRFWEGRFRSQALLDEQAILTAMAYVDLNPIRAGMAETPESSAHTSVAERITDLKTHPHPPAEREQEAQPHHQDVTPTHDDSHTPPALRPLAHLDALPQQPLLPFDATYRQAAAIPFAWADYLDLIEMTGRCQHPGKRGLIHQRVPQLLQRLQIEPEQFIDCTLHLLRQFGRAVGTPAQLTELCAQRQLKYLRGIRTARNAYGSNARAA